MVDIAKFKWLKYLKEWINSELNPMDKWLIYINVWIYG